MSVAIIVPVLGRPVNIAPLMASVAAATPESHRLLFVANADDADELAALKAAGADHLVVSAARRSWACKINDGYRATTEEWVFTGADDLAFHPGWFSRALAWAADGTAVIGTNDICNTRVMTGRHSTHTLFRRSYVDEYGTIDQPGLVMHEGYGHDYADDEAVSTAKARGVYAHAFDAIVEHLHPLVGKAADDATYRAGRRHSQAGRRLFINRSRLWAAPSTRPARQLIPAPPRAAVITACYGGIDSTLRRPVAQDMPVDWICWTDQVGLEAPPPWRVIHEAARHEHPNLAAKVHKATPTVDCPDVIWIDASMEITSPSFAREALAARHDAVAVFKHPRRDCIYDEAEASLGVEAQGGKYAGQPLMEQVAHYRAEGHPADGGLYACGVVAWDLADPRAVELGRAWLAECQRWSWQDQLSFPVVCRRLGVIPGVFPLRQIERTSRQYLANRWLRIWPHTIAAPASVPPADVSVLVPFASDDEHRVRAHHWVLNWYRRHFPLWEIVEAGCDGAWSKGAALAAAAAEATHDIFVVADADSIVPAGILAEATRQVAAGTTSVMPHRRVYRLSQAHTERVYAGAEPEPRDLSRSAYTGVVGGGITVLARSAWETVGGIDPRFVGWGGEDLAFGWALETLCGPPMSLEANLYHLWHEQEPKGARRRGSPASEALAGRYRDARGHPDAMRTLIAEHAVGVLV